MDAFKTHAQIINDYKEYLKSFLSISDARIKEEVEKAFEKQGFIPEPLVQFNPSFAKGESLQKLVEDGSVHADLPRIFGSYQLYKHQVEALKVGIVGKGFVVTSGTGSGKSLTYLSTIFDYLLKLPKKEKGIKAILVYPMNALINSQEEEIKKYEENYGSEFPITFAKYTGQEDTTTREAIRHNPPDIILTNYMMLELIMTRHNEEWMRNSMSDHLQFLVFDELHTYRGRQGSDVSLLIRRIKKLASKKVICIGTSATMASDGSVASKKQAVAEVAETIFGDPYETSQIIGETLETCTDISRGLPSQDQVSTAVNAGISAQGLVENFVTNPLAKWLENDIALQDNEGTLERGKPKSLSSIAGELSEISKASSDKCKEVVIDLLKWTERLNIEAKRNNEHKSYLPYRFHQFISQTSTVFVTLEDRDSRKITIEAGRYVKSEDNEDQLIYPVLFSRTSGVEFICVEKDVENKKLLPRNIDEPVKSVTQREARQEGVSEELFKNGYLLLENPENPFWSENDVETLPDSWFIGRDVTRGLDPFYQYQIPQPTSFDKDGNYSSDINQYPIKGWFLSAKLRVDPTAGIIYEDTKTNENTKLMRLGNEGRSTATTLMAYSVINSLHEQQVSVQNQKLLSFTDNRQDASLQAGHFNDFLSTVRLRSALYHALEDNSTGLKAYDITERVFEKLKLKEIDYAREPSTLPGFSDEENERALKDYLLIRIFYDLKKGWRYTLPNLEQTGLLQVGYTKLEQFCALDDIFQSVPLLNNLSKDERHDVLKQVLEFFRTSYAINHPKLMDQRAETENFLNLKLDPSKLWSLDQNERIDTPNYLRAANPGRTRRGIYTASMGNQSILGKYIKRIFADHKLHPLSPDDYRDFIESLCDLLVKGNFLKRKDRIVGNRGEVKGYQLRADSIIWQPGDKKTVPVDKVRISSYRELIIKPNPFFQKLYQRDFTSYQKQIVGKEHTGQLGNEDRIERESEFREGDISSLFCSPTMELGIDIADLNIVHMRNVPPNPANYAQRSGRAGRSGQTALVMTYCSAWSPHDRNYFKQAESMVAGSVVPPRIDLKNEELIRAHFNAFILMDLGLGDLNKSVAELIDLASSDLPLKQNAVDNIKNSLHHNKDKWVSNYKTTIAQLLKDIKSSYWYQENWFEVQANSFLNRFNEAFDRWRTLYRNAKSMTEKARIIIDDPTIRYDSPEKKEARNQRSVGEKQMALLTNEAGRRYGNESEFYVFRYLASEGFLPGYNFTRLPIRAFVGYKHQDQGEYISRPRFIALREFGPQNLIYHNGSKYRINRMMLIDGETKLRHLKISNRTGYAFMDEEAKLANNDPITRNELKGDSNVDNLTNLLELSEVEGIPQERISCEEEERTSQGFDIDQYFRYIKGIDSTKQTVIKLGSQPLLNIIYGPSTELIQLSRKWRRTTDKGFNIDKRNGKWLRIRDLEDQTIAENAVNTMLFARDTSDTLYIQPVKDLGIEPNQVVSLAFALKRGIESLFQTEENEIGVWVMGDPEEPNIMLYEAAEGSLGILSQIIENEIKMKDLFKAAYRAMHFNPETREDSRPEVPKATYEDLLSYYNQRHHEVLDRFSIREALERLIDSTIERKQGSNDRETQYQYLLEAYDKNSATELKLLKYLYKNGYALPDKAQVNVEEYYISADFVYNAHAGPVLIFCDGSVHDTDQVKEDDAHKRGLLRNAGYDVIEWHYSCSMEDLINMRKDVFRKVH